MTPWETICDYLLRHEDCKDIHKIVWPSDGFAMLSDKTATRTKVTEYWTLQRVKDLVREIREVNGWQRLQRIRQ